MSNKTRLILFTLIFVFLFVFIFEPANHINRSVDSYKYKYSNADVLVIGSSHAYCNLSAATLWHEYGITSSFIAQGEQPISFSYYMLKSSLRYSKPKLVILESYMAASGTNVSYDRAEGQYINALLGYPIYKNLDARIEAASYLDTKYKLPYIAGFPNWDSSYNFFDGVFGKVYDSVGCQYLTSFNKDDQWTEYWSTSTINRYDEISEYSEKYLLKISDLCRKNNIPLLCLITPYQMSSEHAARINTTRKLAEENGIDFIDMNDYVDEMNIDLSTEMVNWGHTLVTASDKASRWLAPVLIEKYNITDRRDNIKYSKWDDCYDYYLNKKKEGISDNDLETCLRILYNDDTLNFSIALSPAAQKYISEHDDILQFLPSNTTSLFNKNGEDVYLCCNGHNIKSETNKELFTNYSLKENDVIIVATDVNTGEVFTQNLLSLE